MAPLIDTGDPINPTISFIAALAVSLAHAHYTSVMLKQQKQIAKINVKWKKLVYLAPPTGLSNKTTVECQAEQLLYHCGTADLFGFC